MNGAKGETLDDLKNFLEFNNTCNDNLLIDVGFQKLVNKYNGILTKLIF